MAKSKVLKSVHLLVVIAALLVPFRICTSAAQDVSGAKSFTITNPYETVEWATWGHYKANLHTHSTVSDGDDPFSEVVEAYYAKGYDILAITDHGAVNRGWNITPIPVPLLGYHMIFKKPVPLTEKRYQEITTGSDRGGRGMTDVIYGIEQNAGTLTKTHVNSFFLDYGYGIWGKENDYKTCIAAVDKLGGLSHINHPGDWLKSRNDASIAKDPKNIKFFADLLKEYPSCLGIEINYSYDTATRNDRVLWDGLLESVIPSGRNVWGFSNSDSHKISDIDSGFEIFMMPSNNLANVRTAMENGTFFACGQYAQTGSAEPVEYPAITSISVDDNKDQITIQGTGYDTIQWIAKDDNVIATGNTIDLNSYEDTIGYHVRAQLLGPGGICMTQAFITDDGSPPPNEINIPFFIKLWNNFVFAVKSTRIYVIFDELILIHD